MPVSLRKFEEDGTGRQEVAIHELPRGARFCLRTPSVWGYPEVRVYGELLYINASRSRVLLSGGQHQVVFGEKDGAIRVFEAQGAAEVSWPRDITVEPIDWEGYTAAQNVRDEDPGERSSVMTDTQATQATGIQARYDYHVKMLKKAEEAGDEAKAILMQGKITQIKNEAETKGVTLHEMDATVSEGGPVKHAVKGEGPKQPRPLTGAAKKAAEAKAARLAAQDPEAAAAMANLDKVKQKKDPAAAPAPKKPASTHDCLCGCGRETLSLYAPGHDARVKGIILKVERGQMKPEDVPETVQPFVRFKGKWGTEGYTLTAAPVKIPGRDDVKNTSLEALEAMDV